MCRRAVFNSMGVSNQTSSGDESLINIPDHPVGYVMVLLAVVTGVIHLLLVPNVIGFSRMMATLFALNGLGFFGIIALYFTRFWRPELYVLAAVYALATIVALFLFPEVNFSLEVFYRQGNLNPMAVVSKAVEAGMAVCALYLYSESS